MDERPRMCRLWRVKGLWCLVLDTGTGHHCGYVQIPEDHPWYGVYYNGKTAEERELGKAWMFAVAADSKAREAAGDPDHFLNALNAHPSPNREIAYEETVEGMVSVHGGITFSELTNFAQVLDQGDGIPEGWWIGFDCAHAGDAPSPLWLEAMRRSDEPWERERAAIHDRYPTGEHYWTLDETATEVLNLAVQVLAAAGVTVGGEDDGVVNAGRYA